MDGWLDRQRDRQTDRQTGRQAGRQGDGQADRQPLHREASKQSSFYTKHPLHTEAFTQGSFCTEAFYRFYTQSSFYIQRLLHRAAFSLCTAFAHQVPRLPRQTTASSPGVPSTSYRTPKVRACHAKPLRRPPASPGDNRGNAPAIESAVPATPSHHDVPRRPPASPATVGATR